MFKKIASIAIAAMMLGSTAAVAASAAENEEPVAAADNGSVVGADDGSVVGADDGSESTGAGNVIYFDANSAGWKNYQFITFYLYDHANGEIITWGSKNGRMKDGGNGIWSFDLDAKGITLDSSNAYGCIFTADWGMQTCDLIIGADCAGDTAYCTGNQVENNVDSNKKSYEVKWKSGKYGNPYCITSIGNVIGDCFWPGDTAYAMFVKFLSSDGKDGLQNALKYNGKDSQTTIDDTAKALGLGQDDIEKAVAEATAAGAKIDWKKASSSANAGSTAGETTGGGNTTGGSDTSGSSTSGGSTSGGSSTGGSSTGTGSVTSGEDSTIYFIIGGVMLAAIGVFFLARKKREY